MLLKVTAVSWKKSFVVTERHVLNKICEKANFKNAYLFWSVNGTLKRQIIVSSSLQLPPITSPQFFFLNIEVPPYCGVIYHVISVKFRKSESICKSFRTCRKSTSKILYSRVDRFLNICHISKTAGA